MRAGRRFHRIRGFEPLAQALTGVPFTNYIAENASAARRVAT